MALPKLKNNKKTKKTDRKQLGGAYYNISFMQMNREHCQDDTNSLACTIILKDVERSLK